MRSDGVSGRCVRVAVGLAAIALMLALAPVAAAVEAWVDSTIQTGHFTSVSIALDSHGYPHVSYWDGWEDEALKYAAWNGSNWDIQIVDAGADVWYYGQTCLQLDSLDRPHISYPHEDHGSVEYAFWNGTAWECEVVRDMTSLYGCSGHSLGENDIP